MIYSDKIQAAIRFSIKTHEVYQKQKRKGKDIPYIIHPLTVGLILAAANASEAVIVAGILHDTIEDSPAYKKVNKQMIQERFGVKVAQLVDSVTEPNRELSWAERKAEALEHIKTFSNDSVLVKSADLIANLSEMITDFQRDGEATFKRFGAPKEKLIENYIKTVTAVIKQWNDNPLKSDLQRILKQLKAI